MDSDNMKSIALKMLLFGIILGAGILILTELISEEAEAEGMPVAIITMDTVEQTANVGPGETGIVRFTGQVEVYIVGPAEEGQIIVANLEANASFGWNTSINPTTLYFSVGSTETKCFEIEVRVPNFTSFATQGELVTSGTVTFMSGNESYPITETKGIISIAPYYLLEVEPLVINRTIKPGGSTEIELSIRNTGNAMEQFRISWDNKESSITLRPSMTNIVISEGESVNITVQVSVDEDCKGGDEKIKITVTAENSLVSGQTPAVQEVYLHLDIDKEASDTPGFTISDMFPVMALCLAIALWRRK